MLSIIDKFSILVNLNFNKSAGLLKFDEKLFNDIFGWAAYYFAKEVIKNINEEYLLNVGDHETFDYFLNSDMIYIIKNIVQSDLVATLYDHDGKIAIRSDNIKNLPKELQFSLDVSMKKNPDIVKKDERYTEYDQLYNIHFIDMTGTVSERGLKYDDLYKSFGDKITNLYNRIYKYQNKIKYLQEFREYPSEENVEIHSLLQLCKSIPNKSIVYTLIDQNYIKSIWSLPRKDLYTYAPSKIKVTLYFNEISSREHYDGEPWAGLYETPSGESDMPTISLVAIPNCLSTYDFKERLQNLRNTLRHELQHHSQDTNHTVKFKEWKGLPSKSIRDNKVNFHGQPIVTDEKEKKPRIEHALRDVEFYTRLSDEADRFNQKYGKVPQQFKSQLAKATVGLAMDIDSKKHPSFPEVYTSHFFAQLHEHQLEKWKKAVKEFFKAVDVL